MRIPHDQHLLYIFLLDVVVATVVYSGRSGVYELVLIDDTLRDMIHDHQPEPVLKKHARSLFPSIRQDGYKRVLAGDTSLEEVIRVTSEE